MVKVCNKCKVEKDVVEFSKDKNIKDGYRCQCKSCIKEYRKEYYEANKERANECSKEYYKANEERVKEYSKKYYKERKKTDDLFKLKCNLRVRTSNAFRNKGYRKNTKTQHMLGVDWEVAKQHIERQFTKGMNWGNHGEWHIDHIIPLASAKTPERLKQLCHYTNLQPMWAEENISKKDKIIGQQTLLRI